MEPRISRRAAFTLLSGFGLGSAFGVGVSEMSGTERPGESDSPSVPGGLNGSLSDLDVLDGNVGYSSEPAETRYVSPLESLQAKLRETDPSTPVKFVLDPDIKNVGTVQIPDNTWIHGQSVAGTKPTLVGTLDAKDGSDIKISNVNVDAKKQYETGISIENCTRITLDSLGVSRPNKHCISIKDSRSGSLEHLDMTLWEDDALAIGMNSRDIYVSDVKGETLANTSDAKQYPGSGSVVEVDDGAHRIAIDGVDARNAVVGVELHSHQLEVGPPTEVVVNHVTSVGCDHAVRLTDQFGSMPGDIRHGYHISSIDYDGQRHAVLIRLGWGQGDSIGLRDLTVSDIESNWEQLRIDYGSKMGSIGDVHVS